MTPDNAARVLAIDFGTSYTTAAIRTGDAAPVLLEIDERSRQPSAVFLSESGEWVTGPAAEAHGVLAPDRLERAPKRYLGARIMVLGGEAVKVTDAAAAVLRVVWGEALRACANRPPSEVRLTHPAAWGQERKKALQAAAAAVGITAAVLVPEPVAAAVYLGEATIGPGDHVAVYDLGGGTFDTTVLVRTNTGFHVVGAPGGIDRLGGEDFDERLYLHAGGLLAESAPETWEALRFSEERTWRKANTDMLTELRRAKEALSHQTTVDLYLGSPIDYSLRLTRSEFEDLVRDDLASTVKVLAQTVRGAGLTPGDLSALYLVGGSSRIPLVTHLVGEYFGRPPTTLGDPKTVVALGAAKAVPETAAGSAGVRPVVAAPRPPAPAGAAPGAAAGGGATVPVATVAAAAAVAPPQAGATATQPLPAAVSPMTTGPQAAVPAAGFGAPPGVPPAGGFGAVPAPTTAPGRANRAWIVAVAVVAVLAIGGIVTALVLHNRSQRSEPTAVTSAPDTTADVTSSSDSGGIEPPVMPTVPTDTGTDTFVDPEGLSETEIDVGAREVAGVPAGERCLWLYNNDYSYEQAQEIWDRLGRPADMDADGNGIPCESRYFG